MPRPSVPEADRKTKHIHFIVTEEQYNRIYALAEEEGRPLSQWCAVRIMQAIKAEDARS